MQQIFDSILELYCKHRAKRYLMNVLKMNKPLQRNSKLRCCIYSWPVAIVKYKKSNIISGSHFNLASLMK